VLAADNLAKVPESASNLSLAGALCDARFLIHRRDRKAG